MVASVSTTSSYARRSLSFSDTIKRSPCYRRPNTPDIKIKYYYKSIINLWTVVVRLWWWKDWRDWAGSKGKWGLTKTQTVLHPTQMMTSKQERAKHTNVGGRNIHIMQRCKYIRVIQCRVWWLFHWHRQRTVLSCKFVPYSILTVHICVANCHPLVHQGHHELSRAISH